ncbi:MAG: hypothetical protein IPM24_00370 [Bryobacterales bacterium]|nr:hypothetical protein [Bryobacterales bacterium]
MHEFVAELLRRPVRVAVIGCGGTGCAMAAGLPHLHQSMLVAGHPGGLSVTVMDGDAYSGPSRSGFRAHADHFRPVPER